MFTIYAVGPRYDNRDAIVGTSRHLVTELPSYETAEFAHKMCERLNVDWDADFHYSVFTRDDRGYMHEVFPERDEEPADLTDDCPF